jgi:hypothetical protein
MRPGAAPSGATCWHQAPPVPALSAVSPPMPAASGTRWRARCLIATSPASPSTRRTRCTCSCPSVDSPAARSRARVPAWACVRVIQQRSHMDRHQRRSPGCSRRGRDAGGWQAGARHGSRHLDRLPERRPVEMEPAGLRVTERSHESTRTLARWGSPAGYSWPRHLGCHPAVGSGPTAGSLTGSPASSLGKTLLHTSFLGLMQVHRSSEVAA